MQDTQKAVDLYLKAIKDHVQMGGPEEIQKAFELLRELDDAKKAGIENDLIMLIGRFNSIQRERSQGILDSGDYRREVARIKLSLLYTVDTVPQKLSLNAQVAGLNGWDFEVPDDDHLEKIIGKVSNLYKISWLQKAINSAKSVCRVVCDDGSMGTGFLIEGNYLITNNHVLPDARMASNAEIEFNFEEDITGAQKQRVTYRLDHNDFVTNSMRELDFTRVKVIENPNAEPLSHWGYLTIKTDVIPKVNSPVTIIQHPKGKEKHIALTANEVLAVQGNKVLYKTDTEPGSSGSPVFDKDWNVVALHHAGKLLKEGGMRIKETGTRVSANRGIIFKYINDFLENSNQATPDQAFNDDDPAPDSSESTSRETNHPVTPEAAEPTSASSAAAVAPSAVGGPATDDNLSGLSIFVMYERNKDKSTAQAILAQLSSLAGGQKKVAIVDMHEGRTFGKQKERWEQAIDTATLVLPLVSPHFFKNRDKLFDLTQYADEKNVLIIPVLVEPTKEYNTSFLMDLEPLPMSGEFISNLADKNVAYAEIGSAIKDYLDSI